MTTTKVTFSSNRNDPFAVEVQERVRDFFKEQGGNDKANGLMYFKTLFYYTALAFSFAWVLSNPFSGAAYLIPYAVFGFFAAGIGINIGHDALHGGFSNKASVNRWMGHSFTLLGAQPYNWKILHNVIHHSYTNIAGADGDLHPGPWFRFYGATEGQKPFHAYQHLYALPLYAMTSLVWVFQKDFQHMKKTQHFIYKKPTPPKYEYHFLVASKLAYLFAVIGLPVLLGGYSIPQALLGFLVLQVVQGLYLALIFQLGHLVEGPQVSHLDQSTNTFDSPLRHQLIGTANFARKSHLITWIAGGLNFQIEHHLFPKVCHIHYPKLAPIVKETAEKYGLPYHDYPTMASALRSHFRLLKAAGRFKEAPKRNTVETFIDEKSTDESLSTPALS